MPFILSAVFGLLLSSIFIYFTVSSLLLASIPSVLFVLKRKYFYALFALLLCMTGLFYGNLIRQAEKSAEKIQEFQGYIMHKKDNLYFFKTSEGNIIKAYYENKLYDDRFYRIICKKSDEHKNPYQITTKTKFCYVQNVIDQGQLKLDLIRKIQQKINNELKRKLSEEASSVLIAMTTGHRQSISKEIQNAFQKTGLIHLLSISGAHFSLLFTVSFIFFRFFLKRLPYKALIYTTLYIKPSQLSILLCLPIILSYFLLVESNYPSTRAFIMASFFIIGVLTERKSLWIITVSIACLIILILEPIAVNDLSFQLSFLATAGIGFVTDIYKNLKDKISSKILSYIALSLLISISATIITAPLIVYVFHYLPIISPIANISAGLLIGMIVFPLNMLFIGIYLLFGVYPFPELINFLASVSFSLMHILASFKFSSVNIQAIPLGSLVLFYFAIFIAIFNFYASKGFFKKIIYSISSILAVSGLLISIFLIKEENNSLKITFLDVGQADTTVIETQHKVFLIDTGKTGFDAEQFLKAKDVKNLQAFIITHEQKDHAGGFEKIIENFRVREIWDNGYIVYNTKITSESILHNSTIIRHLERGDVLKIGNCNFTVLHPYKEFYVSSLSRDSNELSLIFKFKCIQNEYLFVSDAGKEALKTIPVKYLKADIIKVPHHGSKRSLFDGLYETVSPKICIISTGMSNPYGHPHQEVIETLNRICKIYRTDKHGAIQLKELPDGRLHIKTFEGSQLKPYRELENLKKLFILW